MPNLPAAAANRLTDLPQPALVTEIYLDFNATTPVDPVVREAMLPYFTEEFGNPASHHAFGLRAARAVETARAQVAAAIGAKDPSTIVFTSGATESCNFGLRSLARSLRTQGKHIVTQQTEHKAVLEPLHQLEAEGFAVTYLAPDALGRIRAEDVERALTPQTIVVALMAANNEIGTVFPFASIGALCRRRGIAFFSDTVQAISKLPLDVEKSFIDVATMSAHKMYGPKGIGALYIAKRSPALRLAPEIVGGGHERGLRSGTLAVPLIVGFGKACELSARHVESSGASISALRNRLWMLISEGAAGVRRNGDPDQALPGTLNLTIDGIDGSMLREAAPDLAFSAGSACMGAALSPSHVLRAIGRSDLQIASSLRISLGRPTTAAEVEVAGTKIVNAIQRLRGVS